MSDKSYEEKLKREFMEQARSVFERVMAEDGASLSLSEIEEKVEKLRFESNLGFIPRGSAAKKTR